MGFSSQTGVSIIREQSSPGAFAADMDTKGVALRNTSGSMKLNRETLIPDAEIGGGRDVSDFLLGPASCTGDFEAYGRFGSSFATIMRAGLGASITETATSGVYKHRIVPSDSSALPLLSIHDRISSGLEIANYYDCAVSSFKMDVDPNGFLTTGFSIIGKRQELGVPEIDPTDLYDNTGMTVGTNVIVTMGGVNLKPKSLSLEVNNNIEDDDFRLGQFFLEDLTPKRREVSLSMRLRHTDRAMLRQAILGAPTAVEVGGLTTKQQMGISIRSYELIEGTTTYHSLDLSLPYVGISPFSLEPSGDDILENDVEFQVVRPKMSVPLLTAEFTNGVAELS